MRMPVKRLWTGLAVTAATAVAGLLLATPAHAMDDRNGETGGGGNGTVQILHPVVLYYAYGGWWQLYADADGNALCAPATSNGTITGDLGWCP